MYQHFEAEFFINNRKRLRELFVGTAPIVITAHGLLQRNDEVPFLFSQDRNFWYLTGIDEPDIILVIDKAKEYLIVPEHNPTKEKFDGSLEKEALSKISGITAVLSEKEGWHKLNRRLARAKHVATIAADSNYNKFWGLYANPSRRRLIKKLKLANPAIDLLDLRPQLSLMRVVKQPEELAAIQTAIDATIKAIQYVQKRRYITEQEIANELLWRFGKNGALAAGFNSIVSHGARNTTIHNSPTSQPMEPKQLILLDVGAEIEHYSADISRTYSQDAPSKRQRAVHAAVLAVQDYALSLVKPGVTIRDNEQKIEQFMGEKLRELGLIKTIDRPSVRAFFPHATSHYLGLDVHDVGDYTRPLEPNMVITVEPGIYIPKEGIGVRIEDDVLVTKTGHRVLSRRLSRDIS